MMSRATSDGSARNESSEAAKEEPPVASVYSLGGGDEQEELAENAETAEATTTTAAGGGGGRKTTWSSARTPSIDNDDEFDAAAVEAAAAAVEAALASSAREESSEEQDELRSSSSSSSSSSSDVERSSESSASSFFIPENPSAAAVKTQLLDSFFGTNRGLSASAETRSEVNELITRLESLNPTPSPTDAMDSLSGTWRLQYTTNSELLVLLGADNLPLLKIGEMTQTIDAVNNSVENRVAFSAPMLETSVSTSASFDVRSPKRLQVKFKEAGIETPTLADVSLFSTSLPASVDVMGQSVDTAAVTSALEPLQNVASGVFNSLGEAMKGIPGVKVPLPENMPTGSQAWILTTYLDETLRIARGDGGSVFVLTKVFEPKLTR